MLATRPIQEMSDTAAAIRSAKEVGSDVQSPEFYRLANEWFFKAKHEYKFKNFNEARAFTIKARRYAELAEFDSVRHGAVRGEGTNIKDPMEGPSEPSENSPPSPSSGRNPSSVGRATPASPAEAYDLSNVADSDKGKTPPPTAPVAVTVPTPSATP